MSQLMAHYQLHPLYRQLDWIARGWMPPHCPVGCPNVNNPLAVQLQSINRRPSGWCQTHDEEPVRRPDEMLTPDIPTWIKQRNFFPGIRVESSELVSFLAIAVKTSQGEIIKVVRATLGKRDDVIYGESYILPLL